MITAAVCDDEKKVLLDICSKIESAFSGLSETFEITSFDDSFLLLEHIRSSAPNVLFLDIDMPNLGGMDIAQFLIDNDIKTLLVFVTSHDALVYKSFKYRPFAFIRKSFFDEEIGSVVSDIITQLRKSDDSFSFKTGSGLFRVKLCDILYFESDGNYINLHCANGVHKFRGTISSVELELSGKSFIRIHKGFIVNIQHVFALCGDELKLDSGDILPIGRSNKETLKRALMRYMR